MELKKDYDSIPLQPSVDNRIEIEKLEKGQGGSRTRGKAPQMIHFDGFNEKKRKEEVEKSSSILPMSFALKRNGFIKRKDGLAEHHREKIDLVLDSFQERKDKIDKEINAIKQAKKIDLKDDLLDGKEEKIESGEQTPKFRPLSSAKPQRKPSI